MNSERSYYPRIIEGFAQYSIVLFREADGYFITDSGAIVSQKRGTDLYGMHSQSGTYVACEVKVGRRPLISDFEESQKLRLTIVENNHGIALCSYVYESEKKTFCKTFPWLGGTLNQEKHIMEFEI